MLLDINKLKNNVIDFPITINNIYFLPYNGNVSGRFRIFDNADLSKTPLTIIVSANDFKSIELGIYYRRGFYIIVDELYGSVLLDVNTENIYYDRLRVFVPDSINIISKVGGGLVSQVTSIWGGSTFTKSDYYSINIGDTEVSQTFSFDSKLTLFYSDVDCLVRFNTNTDTQKLILNNNFFFYFLTIKSIYVKNKITGQTGILHVWIEG